MIWQAAAGDDALWSETLGYASSNSTMLQANYITSCHLLCLLHGPRAGCRHAARAAHPEHHEGPAAACTAEGTTGASLHTGELLLHQHSSSWL
jgi:hypothetical protein